MFSRRTSYWQFMIVRHYGKKKNKRMNLRDEHQILRHQLFDSRVQDTATQVVHPGKAYDAYPIRDPPLPPRAALQSRKVRDPSEVQIPKRIERGPTDILKALASTVGTDYTAPHYKYHDDPFLIPVSNLAKRSFSLSKEAGRKAAKWVRQQHAELFQHKVASPPVQVFYPDLVISDETEVTEELVGNLINQGHLTDAIQAYQLLKNKDKEISNSTKQSLLEAIAFFNETDPVDEELIEERWYRAGVVARDRQRNTWKENGLAETLFSELEPQDASAYCAMIRGKAKYYHVEKAWNLYTEAKSKGMTIDADTINSLIRVVNFARENSDLRWKLAEELLSDMEESGIQPNVGTLNSILEAVSTMGNIRQSKTLALQTLSEFKNLGIQPTLASYYYILITHCKERGPVDPILVDIMDEIQGKAFTMQHPKDTFFFVSAMDNCRNHLQDLDLANRVNTLLHTGNNYDLIGDSYKESVYYRHFLALKCNMEGFLVFMEYYDKVVPNIYTPEPGIMEEILRSLELNGSIEFLPRIWSDLVIFNQSLRDSLLTLVLQIMANDFPEDPTSELAIKFIEIGTSIYTTIESQNPERGKTTLWTGKMLGDLLTTFVKGGAYEGAGEIVKKLGKGSPDIIGVTDVGALKIFLDAAIKENDAPLCLATIHYANDCGFPDVLEMAEKVYEHVRLDAVQVSQLSNTVGFDVTATKKEDSN